MATYIVYYDRFGDKKQRQYFADDDAGYPYWTNTLRHAKQYPNRDAAMEVAKGEAFAGKYSPNGVGRCTPLLTEAFSSARMERVIICVGEINIREVGCAIYSSALNREYQN